MHIKSEPSESNFVSYTDQCTDSGLAKPDRVLYSMYYEGCYLTNLPPWPRSLPPKLSESWVQIGDPSPLSGFWNCFDPELEPKASLLTVRDTESGFLIPPPLLADESFSLNQPSKLLVAPVIEDCLEMGDGAVNTVDESPEVFSFKRHADEMVAKVDELEQEVTEVKSEVGSGAKDKDTEKQVISIKKKKQDAAKREAASAKRMQELMCQFATILRQAIAKP
ncbi:hypothetical protein BVC80_1835g547 [Macleaya cordata]|uniref:Uncharacterized protein n=1 Tax=Macleaya cordata TaxID=56857 RepID=A0A200R616_MACCD|nr:hypothetical protein BVC80_1835g547 [Macleaya cordata]